MDDQKLILKIINKIIKIITKIIRVNKRLRIDSGKRAPTLQAIAKRSRKKRRSNRDLP